MTSRSSYTHVFSSALFSLALVGCSAAGGADPSSRGNGNSAGSLGNLGNDGPGNLNTSGSSMGGASGESCAQKLPVVYRDFRPYGSPGGHEDFEASARGIRNMDQTLFQGWNDIGCGLVETTLGTDGKPHAFAGTPDKDDGIMLPGLVGKQQRVVNGPGCYPSKTGDCFVGTCKRWSITPISYAIKSTATFDQWYKTIDGVNQEIQGEIALFETPPGSGVSVYDTNAFFPIDGRGYGNPAGQLHNYHFTTEIHVRFTYTKGQKFTFRGDDDLWIFVNGKLALDVGGQHQALVGELDFDAQADALGITPGNGYSMDIFHAERQTVESNFRIETNIRCFEPVVVK